MLGLELHACLTTESVTLRPLRVFEVDVYVQVKAVMSPFQYFQLVYSKPSFDLAVCVLSTTLTRVVQLFIPCLLTRVYSHHVWLVLQPLVFLSSCPGVQGGGGGTPGYGLLLLLFKHLWLSLYWSAL